MSEPKLQFVRTDAEGWCDPVSGVCALPDAAAPDAQTASVRTGERSAADAEIPERLGER